MKGLWIGVWMQLCKVLNIPGFHVCKVSAYTSVTQGSEYAWILLNNAIWQGFEYAWSTFHRGLKKPLVLNMPGLRSLSKPEYALIMSRYAWICLNNAEYDWICRHTPEKNRALDMPEFLMFLMEYIAWVHFKNYWVVIETDTCSELSNI